MDRLTFPEVRFAPLGRFLFFQQEKPMRKELQSTLQEEDPNLPVLLRSQALDEIQMDPLDILCAREEKKASTRMM